MKIDGDLQDEIVKKYLSGRSMQGVANDMGISINTVVDHLNKRKIPRRSNKINSRKYEVDHDFFSEIDSEKKAYWLGFIQADGYLLTRDKTLGIALAEKDIAHLEKFKKDMGATYPIHIYQSSGYSTSDYCRIVIKSEKIWDDLFSLGIHPKKTKNTHPISVRDELERHYIRGLMDADGSIKVSKNSKTGFRGDFVSACKPMANYIADRLGKGSVRLDQKKNVWYSEFSLTTKNLDYLYEKSTTYLQRKYDRAVLARQRLSDFSWSC